MFRRIVSGVTLGVATIAVLGLIDGCLTRPVVSSNPVTKTNFITSIPQGSIDKVDLLFDIDNSASMGDKQAYLAQAIPDLITRLVTPNCLDANGAVTGVSALDGTCTPMTSTPEFPPVHNLHVGIISSSLGARLGNACPTTGPQSTQALAGGGTLNRHNDDQAHLLDRGADPTMLTNYTETPVGAADPDHFLNWFPPSSVNPANAGITPTGPTPIANQMNLNSDFQDMVVGVHQFGCGIESQLENWYRFLIQPDPYADLKLDSSGRYAQWDGVDTTILAQRADFLRPDSLVAILVLTDENDSEVDVRSFGGTAWNFMSTAFNPPRGTTICQTNPTDPGCTSCAFGKNPGDAQCKAGTYPSSTPTDWGYDLNLRHVHEVQKYGVSVQFPIQRYVLGLTSTKVPNRSGEYPSGAQSYQGLVAANQTCTNPLYAAALPTPPSGSSNWNPTESELCNLTVGTRKPNLVFYAHIGGVPHELLQVDPSKTDTASQSQKANLTDADWQLILGKDPVNFDYTGIDPHMVESYQSRTGVTMPSNGFPVADPSQPEGKDPIAGREWVTDSTSPLHTGLLVDREYACIFKLAKPRDCSTAATTADPTLQDSCDCQPPASGSLSHAQVPAVCNDATPTLQDSAKAYPTIRELELAYLLGKVNGANEGIISSLCPIHTTDQSMNGTDPLYGYRPAMNAIISKLSSALAHQCLPQRLTITGSGTAADPLQVPCLVLGTFPGVAGQNGIPSSCTDATILPYGGYSNPDPTVLKEFKADQQAAWKRGGMQGTDPSTYLTCELKQQPPNQDCTNGPNGWCYSESVKGCAQAILFNQDALKGGVDTSLQCIEASNSVVGDAAAAAAPPAADDAGNGGD